jgi:hypothetical protein
MAMVWRQAVESLCGGAEQLGGSKPTPTLDALGAVVTITDLYA